MGIDGEFFESRRNAHRVFRAREGADRFNPFRHFPWDFNDSDSLEAGSRQHDGRTLRRETLWVVSWAPLTALCCGRV